MPPYSLSETIKAVQDARKTGPVPDCLGCGGWGDRIVVPAGTPMEDELRTELLRVRGPEGLGWMVTPLAPAGSIFIVRCLFCRPMDFRLGHPSSDGRG